MKQTVLAATFCCQNLVRDGLMHTAMATVQSPLSSYDYMTYDQLLWRTTERETDTETERVCV